MGKLAIFLRKVSTMIRENRKNTDTHTKIKNKKNAGKDNYLEEKIQ